MQVCCRWSGQRPQSNGHPLSLVVIGADGMRGNFGSHPVGVSGSPPPHDDIEFTMLRACLPQVHVLFTDYSKSRYF